jgi:hypothetical protein
LLPHELLEKTPTTAGLMRNTNKGENILVRLLPYELLEKTPTTAGLMRNTNKGEKKPSI